MIQGQVRLYSSEYEESRLEAVIRLTVSGFGGQEIEADFIIDTGFSGHLSLRPDQVAALALLPKDLVAAIMADGSAHDVTLYDAVVRWDGVDVIVSVVGDDADPLIGMDLLRGFNLSIDVVEGGEVRITRPGSP